MAKKSSKFKFRVTRLHGLGSNRYMFEAARYDAPTVWIPMFEGELDDKVAATLEMKRLHRDALELDAVPPSSPLTKAERTAAYLAKQRADALNRKKGL